MIELNVRAKTPKLLEIKIKNFSDFGFGKDFLVGYKKSLTYITTYKYKKIN